MVDGVTPTLREASRMKDRMLKPLARFRDDEECDPRMSPYVLLRDWAALDLLISCCRKDSNCLPRMAIVLCSNFPRYKIVSATSCLWSPNSLSAGLRCSMSRLRMIAAATEKAWSIHRIGSVSSTATKASRSIVLAAARQVRRVKAKAEVVNDGPINLR